jgi:hypothetical protein
MGISMRLYLAPDSDLYAFTGAPKTLQKWLRSRRSRLSDTWLHGYWRDIDAILNSDPLVYRYSPLTPHGADFVYPTAADHGAHGLSSTSTERLSRSLERVTHAQVESYVQRRSLQPLSPVAVPGVVQLQASPETGELQAYLACLQETCALAFDKKYGLVLALWDL